APHTSEWNVMTAQDLRSDRLILIQVYGNIAMINLLLLLPAAPRHHAAWRIGTSQCPEEPSHELQNRPAAPGRRRVVAGEDPAGCSWRDRQGLRGSPRGPHGHRGRRGGLRHGAACALCPRQETALDLRRPRRPGRRVVL